MHEQRFSLYLTECGNLTEDRMFDIAETLFAVDEEDGFLHFVNGDAIVSFATQSTSLNIAIARAVADVKRAGFGVSKVVIDEDALAFLTANAEPELVGT